MGHTGTEWLICWAACSKPTVICPPHPTEIEVGISSASCVAAFPPAQKAGWQLVSPRRSRPSPPSRRPSQLSQRDGGGLPTRTWAPPLRRGHKRQ
jgi:hypothetical protein